MIKTKNKDNGALPTRNEVFDYIRRNLVVERTPETITLKVPKDMNYSFLTAYSGAIGKYISDLRTEGRAMHLDFREVPDLEKGVLSAFYSACRKKADEEDTKLTLSGITKTQDKWLRSTLNDNADFEVGSYQDTNHYPQVDPSQKSGTDGTQKFGRVISAYKPRSSRLLKYFLPAAIAGMAAFGAYVYANGKPSTSPDSPKFIQKENKHSENANPAQEMPKPKEFPKLEEITGDNLDTIKKGNVIIDVWAPGCGPCKTYTPKFEETAQKYSDRGISFVKINLDENKSALEALVNDAVNAIPCTILMQDGKVVARFAGGNIPTLEKEIEEHYPKDSKK